MSANNMAIVFNATGQQGTLTLDLDALTAGMAVQVFLGNDVASANSVLLGSGVAANDTIRGGANADTIQGGGGADTMYGGAGSDVFVFLGSAGNNIQADQATGQTDLIMDFASGDVLRFSGVSTYSSLAGFTALGGISVSTATLVGQAVATSNAVAIFQDSGNTIVQVALQSGTIAAGFSALINIKLDGMGSWTSLSAVFNAAIAGGTLTITHI
jgi:Ca2+-binding RTX toxin-like protein